MGRSQTLAAVREKYPQYNDMSDDALGDALAAKYPQYADLKSPAGSKPTTPPAPAGKPVDESAVGIATGALKDTFTRGESERPGAVRIAENRPGAKTPLGVVVNPQNAGESL